MPYLKYRNTGRRVPRKARRARRMTRRRYRKPMTTGRVKRIIDAELKVSDLSVEDISIPSVTGSIIRISNIAQGDLNDQRNGNWVKPTTWMGTITLQGNPAADPDTVPSFRIGVVCWKENETLNPISIAQIMQDSVDPHQQFNIENKGQFKILWSRTGLLSNQNRNPQFQKVFRFYVCPSMKVLYDDAAAKNNQLFIFAYTGTDTLLNPPTMAFSTRLRFTDS